MCHADETVITGVVLDEVFVIRLANHNQTCAVGQCRMVGGKRVFKSVFAGNEREAHHYAGQSIAESHMGPRFHILAVLHGAG